MDMFWTLAYQLEKNENCLWSSATLPNKGSFDESFDVCCKLSDRTIDDLVNSVINLYDRAAIRHSLKDIMFKTHGAYLSAQTIYGKSDFWHGFVGCGNYLYEKQYLDPGADNSDLIFNFFMVFASVLRLQIMQ